MESLKTFTRKYVIELDFETNEKVSLPFSLRSQYIPLDGYQPEFYSVLTQLPYGVDTREGNLIIVGDPRGNSVIIKAWMFDDDACIWHKVNNREPEVEGSLVVIEHYIDETTKRVWTPPCLTEKMTRNSKYDCDWKTVLSIPETFRDFMLRTGRKTI